MSYTNGIGSLQQALTAIATAGTKASSAADTAAATAASPATLSAAEHVDKTNLSAAGGIMAKALGAPDTRLAKVAELQQAIATGNYNVSSSDIADKMIHSLLGE